MTHTGIIGAGNIGGIVEAARNGRPIPTTPSY
jgi:hypothetical protein